MKGNRISILGSTGSIGTQALDVVELLQLKVAVLAAHCNAELLETQARRYRPDFAVLTDEAAAARLKTALADTDVKVLAGESALEEAAAYDKTDLVLNAVVGIAGLRPTLAAIGAKKDVALANKETLVTGGALVMQAAARAGVSILPVDSEHSAIFQCLAGCRDRREIQKILLTASGGPFFGRTAAELRNVTSEEALRHPNWNMGAKITIDSATMMNKGFELMEAVWLFQVKPSQVEILVQRESVVHSMVEFSDHSVIAQLGVPDMRLPIQYAVTYPARLPSPAKAPDFAALGTLSFARPDEDAFPALKLCRRAAAGGRMPVAVNAANEEAVALFLNRKIAFPDITALAEAAAADYPAAAPSEPPLSANAIFDTDRAAREKVRMLTRQGCPA